jgi:translation initiation factor 4E
VRGRRGELYISQQVISLSFKVGEELDEGDEICGVAVSLRSKLDRIQLWVRSKEDVEKVNGIGRKLVKLLDVSEADEIGLEFQVNVATISLGSPLFLSVSSLLKCDLLLC